MVDRLKLVLDEMNVAMKEMMKIAKHINAQKPSKGAQCFTTTKIEIIKANNGGKTPNGTLGRIVAANKSFFHG